MANPTQPQGQRERFEAWAKPRSPGLRFNRDAEGFYLDGDTDDMWEAWQAASAGQQELVEALAELLAAETAKFPPAEHGQDAQTAWAQRKAAAEDIASEIISAYKARAEGVGGVLGLPHDKPLCADCTTEHACKHRLDQLRPCGVPGAPNDQKGGA